MRVWSRRGLTDLLLFSGTLAFLASQTSAQPVPANRFTLTCPACNTQSAVTDFRKGDPCPNCGQRIDVILFECPRCRETIELERLPRTGDFCPECGASWLDDQPAAHDSGLDLSLLDLRFIRGKRRYEEIRERIRSNPDPRDLMTGDSLNVLCAELCGAGFPPTVLRQESLALPGKTVPGIPFHYAQAGKIVSQNRLRAEGPWPLALRTPAIQPLREAYQKAVQDALAELDDGELELEDVTNIRNCFLELDREAQKSVSLGDHLLYADARQFLRNLDRATQMLHVAHMVTVLAEIRDYSGTTVSELVDFMHRHNLRFAPAETLEERAIYRELYHVLLEQRNAMPKVQRLEENR